jgi:hypothetical protein
MRAPASVVRSLSLVGWRKLGSVRWGKLGVALLSGSAVLGVQYSALASSTFPEKLQDTLQLPCAPSCTVCHRTSAGGMGTVEKPFGARMRQLGLKANASTAELRRALDALRRAESGEGVGAGGAAPVAAGEGGALGAATPPLESTRYLEALEGGADPNTGRELCLVRYGCGAQVAPAGATLNAHPVSACILLLLGILMKSRAWFRRAAGPLRRSRPAARTPN